VVLRRWLTPAAFLLLRRSAACRDPEESRYFFATDDFATQAGGAAQQPALAQPVCAGITDAQNPRRLAQGKGHPLTHVQGRAGRCIQARVLAIADVYFSFHISIRRFSLFWLCLNYAGCIARCLDSGKLICEPTKGWWNVREASTRCYVVIVNF
jgi:hypothetical protein